MKRHKKIQNLQKHGTLRKSLRPSSRRPGGWRRKALRQKVCKCTERSEVLPCEGIERYKSKSKFRIVHSKVKVQGLWLDGSEQEPEIILGRWPRARVQLNSGKPGQCPEVAEEPRFSQVYCIQQDTKDLLY